MVADDRSEYGRFMPVCITSGVFRLTTPFSPKNAFNVPSAALIEYKPPEVAPKMIDGGREPSPGQKAMPRFDGRSLFGSWNFHFSTPVVASSAWIAPYGDARYIVVPMTIGIASSSRRRPEYPAGLRWKLHTRSSVATFCAVI